MTTSAPPLPTRPLLAPAGGRVLRRVSLVLVLAVAAATALAIGFALGYGRAHDGRILSGVEVAGVDVSGMDRDGATAALRAHLPSLAAGALTVRVGVSTERVDFATVGRDYDLDRMLAAAFAAGRGESGIQSLLTPVRTLVDGSAVAAAVRHDPGALDREARRVAAALSVAPVDARVGLAGDRFTISPSAEGRHVDATVVADALRGLVDTLDPGDATVVLEAARIAPAHASDEAIAAVAAAEALVRGGLELTLPRETSLRIPATTLRTWLTFDPSTRSTPRVVPDRIHPSVAALADAVTRDAVDAEVVAEADGSAFRLAPAVPGRSLDVAMTAGRVLGALSDRQAGRVVPAVPVATALVAPSLSTEEAHAALVTAERITGADLVLAAGSDRVTVPAADLRRLVRFGPDAQGLHAPSVDARSLREAVETAAGSLRVEARSAGFRFTGASAAVAVTPAVVGREIDLPASLREVEAAMADRASGRAGQGQVVQLAVTPVQPVFSTAEAQAAAARVTKISEWTTRYPVGPNNGYGANIRIPAETLDGYVVEPGVTFDFWREIGGVSREKGYLPGAMILGGTTVEPGEIGPDGKPVEGALAGGICSASTTLFNAALRAGFPIETRRNHYYYISRYPLGLDATVWRNGSRIQTMRWTNDTPWPVLIRGVNGEGWVRFELYSVPTGRTVTLAEPVVTDEQEAADSIVFTRNLPEGKTRRAEKPHDGFRVSVARTVRGANGAVIREDTFTSRYGTVRGVLLVGGEGEDIVFPPGVVAHWP